MKKKRRNNQREGSANKERNRNRAGKGRSREEKLRRGREVRKTIQKRIKQTAGCRAEEGTRTRALERKKRCQDIQFTD